MPTVIDSLIVTLGLDARGLATGRTQATTSLAAIRTSSKETGLSLKLTSDQARQAAMQMSASGKVAAEFFGGIKNQAAGLLSVLIGGGGVASVLRDTVTSLSSLGRASTNIGVSLPDLVSFRNAVEANGGSAEAAASSFQHLADQMALLNATGNNSIMSGLGIVGGNRGESAMQIYMKFVDFAAKHQGDVGLIRLVGSRLGLDEGSINQALRGTVQVARDLTEAQKRGVPTKEMVARASELQRAFFGTSQAATNLVNVLVDRFAPALTAILNAVTAFMLANPNAATALGVAGAIGGTVVAGKVAAGAARAVLGGGAAAAGAAGGAVAAGGGGVLAAASRLLAPVAALGLTGAGGGEDAEFSRRKNEEFLRSRGRHTPSPAATATPPAAGSSPGTLFASIEQQRGLPRGLLDSVWSAESGRGRNMRSSAGAEGHFQFMPATGRQYGLKDPNDLGDSADKAGSYLRDLIGQFGGDTRKGIAAYNWGPGNLSKAIAAHGENWASHLPKETTDYLARVTAGMGAGASDVASRSPAGGGDRTQTVNVTGPVTINTQATDAKGLARDFRREMSGPRVASMANTGLS